jgi:hypothetical protein
MTRMFTTKAWRGGGWRQMSMDQASDLSSVVAGPPAPARGEERLFEQRQRDDARAWAIAGEIAIYGDIRHRGPFSLRLRVMGQLPVLFDWAGRQGLSHQCLQGRIRGLPPHFEIAGRLAEAVADRARVGEERPR